MIYKNYWSTHMQAKSKAAIKKHLIDFLQSAMTTDDVLFNSSVVKATAEILKSKKKYIPELEIQIVINTFIRNALGKKGADSLRFASGATFIDIFNMEELSDLAEKIIDYFDSLPRNYTCVFKLPNITSFRPFSVSIDENISLEFNETKKTSGVLNALIHNTEYYLSIIIKYHGYLSSSDYEIPYGIFKHIVGIAIAFDYFESNVFLSGVLLKGLFGNNKIGLNTESYFFDNTTGEQSKINMHFSDSVNDKLYDLEFSKKINRDEYENTINHIIMAYKSFSKDEEHARRLQFALEWSYDAAFTSNTTFTFILNCIAIEALMGDSGTAVGITLGNRIAYMLGKDNTNRKYIMEEIKKLYKLRSNLVHGNQSRPSKEDTNTRHFATLLLNKLIKHELSILRNVSN
jgi:hypothetical protein